MKKRISGLVFGLAMLVAGSLTFNAQSVELAEAAEISAGTKCGTFGSVGPIYTCRGTCSDCVIVTPKK